MVKYPAPWMIAGESNGYIEGPGHTLTPGLASLVHHFEDGYNVHIFALEIDAVKRKQVLPEDIQAFLEMPLGLDILKGADHVLLQPKCTVYVPPGMLIFAVRLSGPSYCLLQQPVWSANHAKHLPAPVWSQLQEWKKKHMASQMKKSPAWKALKEEFEEFLTEAGD